MRFDIITLFPEFFTSPLGATMLRKGQERGALEFRLYNIRDFATDKHRVTDDTPYGGGAGMVMKVEPLAGAIEASMANDPPPWRVLLSPQGVLLSQSLARDLAQHQALALICGRYEGVDERVKSFMDIEVSVGDYVLSGGEAAALVLIDAVSRLVPGVLGSDESVRDESFAAGLLEYPQYTRPPEYRGLRVPDILLSGDHGAIARWRRRAALERTARQRPDLLRDASLTAAERQLLDRMLRDE